MVAQAAKVAKSASNAAHQWAVSRPQWLAQLSLILIVTEIHRPTYWHLGPHQQDLCRGLETKHRYPDESPIPKSTPRRS
jgi:hypothetical protein